jgi:hypothetical protein
VADHREDDTEEQDAGPLHAHLGGPSGHDLLCDADAASLATNAGTGGASVTVNIDGPANPRAFAATANGRTQQLHDVISARRNEYRFEFPYRLDGVLDPHRVRRH